MQLHLVSYDKVSSGVGRWEHLLDCSGTCDLQLADIVLDLAFSGCNILLSVYRNKDNSLNMIASGGLMNILIL